MMTIAPHEGVGPLKFGMSIRNARCALEEPLLAVGKGWAIAESFLKDARRDGIPVDSFSELGIHIYYRIRGDRLVCAAVELFRPASPTLRGHALLEEPFASTRRLIESLDPEVSADGSGLVSRGVGLSLYAPDGDDEPPDSVYVFERGEWDRELPPIID